jgi:hypothetical protein
MDLNEARNLARGITLAADREAVAAAEERARVALCFFNVFGKVQFAKYNMMANQQIISDYHHGESITEQSIDESIQRLGSPPLAIRTLSQMQADAAQKKLDEAAAAKAEREQVISDLLELGASTELQQRFPRMSTAELLQKKADIELQQKFQSMPYDEQRQFAREQHAISHPNPGGFPRLPAQYSAKWLKLYVDGKQMRELIKLYGMAAINERLNAKE